ncbi:TonB-dependent receptor [Frateuria defendens]|uniref:TonB-dependent receptor n=1 Tax=Frateuria defendens TaxID=2219559 RepID=UPI00066FBDEE|nr:TonB-dependent receptor [Frateuria defendens]
MRRTTLGAAVAGVLGLSVLTLPQVAHAQSSYGTIYGSARAGDTVHITSASTGRSQDVTVGGNGQYAVNGLPLGHYTVTLVENGATTATQETTVVAGSSIQVNFANAASAASARQLQAVTVTAPSPNSIDVKSTTVRTVFTAEQLQDLPVPRNVLAVAALTPGTVGNSTFGPPSFGGSSSAENSYYIDGFNVTDMYNSMSFAHVPWFAIAQEDVQTGSYGPEYGFSTGGVVSVNTKQGTNQWKGGVDVQVSPYAWQGHAPDVYYRNGNLARSYEGDNSSDRTYSAWIGGPIIKDKLFFFGAAQFSQDKTSVLSNNTQLLPPGGYSTPIQAGAWKTHKSSPYYLGRLDWNITDNNTATWTSVNNVNHEAQRMYDLAYDSQLQPHFGNYVGTGNYKTGGRVNVFKDVWQITDGLTLTAIYGHATFYNPNEGNPQSVFAASSGVKSTYNGVLGSAGTACPAISDQRAGILNGSITQPIQGCSVFPAQSTSNPVDKRKTGTVNLEWVVGDHDIVGGASKESFTSKGGSTQTQYTYQTDDGQGSFTGTPYQDYTQQFLFQTSASVGIHTTSAYLKDSWTIDQNWLFNYGVRYDKFSDYNGSGDTFIKQSHIWQPRLGLSWDVFGDSSLKLYATAGRYALPVDSGVALRAGSPSIFTYDYFTYSGVDPATGLPINAKEIPGSKQIINGESGQPVAPGSYSDQSLKPYTQDEYTLGFQKSLDDGWILGVQLMRRHLHTAIDDFCDWRPFAAWGAAHGYGDAMAAAGSNVAPPVDQGGCFLFNPGSGGTWNVDLTGNGQQTPVHLSAADIGSPKAKRDYNSVTFSFERQWDNVWYLKGSYVWSQSYGNTEGMVGTDVGPTGQADAGTTQAFDYPEIMQGAGGYLPNDHRHVINLFGAWKFKPEWQLGFTVNIASGAPISCYGYYPDTAIAGYEGYGNSYHYCNGNVGSDGVIDTTTNTVSSRGHAGRTPWTYVLSPSLSYMPERVKGLTLRLSATNLLNNVKPVTVYYTGQTGGSSTGSGAQADPTYKLGNMYETPRQFMLEAQYDFNL